MGSDELTRLSAERPTKIFETRFGLDFPSLPLTFAALFFLGLRAESSASQPRTYSHPAAYDASPYRVRDQDALLQARKLHRERPCASCRQPRRRECSPPVHAARVRVHRSSQLMQLYPLSHTCSVCTARACTTCASRSCARPSPSRAPTSSRSASASASSPRRRSSVCTSPRSTSSVGTRRTRCVPRRRRRPE